MEAHLGYAQHDSAGNGSGNSRNGTTATTLNGQHDEVAIEASRDRASSFGPQFIRKGQTRLRPMNDQILALYAKRLSTQDIVAAFREIYDAVISATLVSQVTDRVLEAVAEWQNHPLDAVYPIVYLDCIVLKVRHDKRVVNKSMYVALGIGVDGHKQLLGLWLAESEGASFWLSVLTELKNRGLQDILIACVDGLKGFPEAILAEYPHTRVQLCVVHMVRNSLRYVCWRDYKAVSGDLKRIYQAPREAAAARELEAFIDCWGAKYAQIGRSWTAHRPHLITLFEYPPEIRRVIYTTNAIESLNSVIRKARRQRKVFPSDDSAMKVVYLAMQAA